MIYLLKCFWEFIITWFCVLKDSPLLHILEMYELCMNCKKYNEARTKLDKFQDSLTKVRKFVFSEFRCRDLAVGLREPECLHTLLLVSECRCFNSSFLSIPVFWFPGYAAN